MSRIEEALEKAALLRSNEKTDVIVRKTAAVAAQVQPQSLSPKATINVNPLIITVSDPQTPAAEEYRKLKSMLVKFTKGEHFMNTLMVTSSIASEGKSITALNLAISLAQEYDHTVLLVDADLRKPSIHQYLGLQVKVGLGECLMDGIDVGDALIKTGIGKLTLLPQGKTVRNPAELFSSKRMKELVKELKHRYPDRYIIIDAPPVLPFAETRTISSIVDGIIFVVKEGAASINDVHDALAALKGTNILGIVYNDACIDGIKDHYNYYYQANAEKW
jgi:exopolysaccharide/PEP-CTERM locus tyrosine autokinase